MTGEIVDSFIESSAGHRVTADVSLFGKYLGNPNRIDIWIKMKDGMTTDSLCMI